MPNAFDPEWETERAGCRVAMVAAAAGARRLGASVVEVPPGGLSSPYHIHHANEELLVVLSGTPELRTPDGHRRLTPGEVVSFARGPDGAHRLRNTSTEPCRLLFVSEMNFPDVAEYPDTGATLTRSAAGRGLAFPAASERPVSDLVAAALRADPRSRPR
ncbi:MAG TPA: cupin domain-containing protein [Chloroflexota bacterium]|jgi:uncharacterized cupin superfamily protein|nr:cupin domain-containing protein [Chloroflexota bacterium]